MLAPVWLFSQSVFELESFRFLSFHLKLTTQQEVDISHISDKRMVWNSHIRSTISRKMINLWFGTSELSTNFPKTLLVSLFLLFLTAIKLTCGPKNNLFNLLDTILQISRVLSKL